MYLILLIAVSLAISINTEGLHSIETNRSGQQTDYEIDNRDYESVNEILNETNIFVRNFDYYMGPTAKVDATTTPGSPKPLSVDSRSLDSGGHHGDPNRSKSGATTIIIISVVVVVIVLLLGLLGMFMVLRPGKGGTHRKREGKGNRASIKSLASIETVASDTGKPLKKDGRASIKGKGGHNRK